MSKAILTWNLYIDCPNCEEVIDLAEMDEDGWISIPIFNNKWEDLVGQDVTCPLCDTEFEIDKIEY